ncbi:MAG: hypothetical protein V1676_03475 [Candidatus Diapherotrites archaeon]
MLSGASAARRVSFLPLPKTARGFIGPIGDDLPSLIPLLFALVVFFSTFAFAFGVFEARDRDFQHDLKALQLAHALKANGYIGSAAEFSVRCASLGISGMKYRAFVTDVYAHTAAAAEPEILDIYRLAPFSLGGDALECTNSGEPFSKENALQATVVVKVYPVAVEDNMVVKPMHLVVIAWR